ncbi:MAG: hypothetical protein GXP59_02295, partial [Deltaproteobacteria bacterium]|nr:hypothetical protein [Deltaproteobacteria bacterium]
MTIPVTKKILIISYSFSGQTSCLIRRLKAGLERQGHEVIKEHIEPAVLLRFPTGSIYACLRMMFVTLFRHRTAIAPLSGNAWKYYDLIILAGPTWSYNPSGPILYLLDHFGKKLFKGRTVIPLISCRGYWRAHWLGLRRILKRCGAVVPNYLVFSHPCSEPWRTIGVFMKISGKSPEHSALLRGHYSKFG